MAKKQYKIEATATSENIAKLKNSGVEFTLYEVNEVKRESGSFAGGSNFATRQLILKETNEIDDKEYTPQQLRNYTANLSRNLYGKPMTKEVRL